MTPDNRIWHLRKARDLTQRVLAEKVGTSQQQIQRIEAGVIAVRLDLAVKIANALGTRLGDVFPKLAKAEKKRGRRKAPAAQVNQELSNAGIDPDPRHWTVKFFTRDGRVFLYGISSS